MVPPSPFSWYHRYLSHGTTVTFLPTDPRRNVLQMTATKQKVFLLCYDPWATWKSDSFWISRNGALRNQKQEIIVDLKGLRMTSSLPHFVNIRRYKGFYFQNNSIISFEYICSGRKKDEEAEKRDASHGNWGLAHYCLQVYDFSSSQLFCFMELFLSK